MGRQRTGSVDPYKRVDGTAYYRARIWLADGTRERVDIPEKYSHPKERAQLFTHALQEHEDATGDLLAKKKQRIADEAARKNPRNVETYWDLLCVQRKAKGNKTVDRERRLWKARITPHLGHLILADVVKEQIEDFRNIVDREVLLRDAEGDDFGLSGSSGSSIWTLVRTVFGEAVDNRDRSMQWRKDNPTDGVKPPIWLDGKQKTFIFPTEFGSLVSCPILLDDDEALEWIELDVIATYTYVRPNELKVLTLGEVLIDQGYIDITRAWDEERNRIDVPKTRAGIRHVPIDPALLPLLKRLRDQGSKDDLVAPLLTSASKHALHLRDDLKLAGVERERLFIDTKTTRMVDFRSCRDTGITWEALRQTPVERIRVRAGHDDIKTTIGYIKLAEDLGGKLGVPFAPLPKELIERRSKRPSKRPSALDDEESVEETSSGCWTRTSEERNGSPEKPQNHELDVGASARVTTRTHVSKRPGGPIEIDARSELWLTLRAAREAGDLGLARDVLREIRAAREEDERDELVEHVKDGAR